MKWMLACGSWLLLLLSVGCSPGQLSRSAAAELIRESDEYSKPFELPLPTRTPAMREAPTLYGYVERAGYASIKRPSTVLGIYELTFTDDGRQAAQEWSLTSDDTMLGQVWQVPLATRQLREITGITRPSEVEAIVEFSWEWSPVNTLGHALIEDGELKTPTTGLATLMLYDDGWRLKGIAWH